MAQSITPAPVYEGSVASYADQLAFYFDANDVEEKKQKSIFLSAIPRDLFETATHLVRPKTLSDKTVTLKELVKKLKSHEKPKVSKTVARYHFDELSKRSDERVLDFVVRINEAAFDCEFSEEERENRVRDRFISGLQDEGLLRAMLRHGEDTLTGTIDHAVASESAVREAEHMAGEHCTVLQNSFAKKTQKFKESRKSNPVLCFNCGAMGYHIAKDCTRKKPDQCFRCGKFGHMETACRKETDSKNGQRGTVSS